MTEYIFAFLACKHGVSLSPETAWSWSLVKVPESVYGVRSPNFGVLQRKWKRLSPGYLPLLVATPLTKRIREDLTYEVGCVLRHAAKLWLEGKR